MNLQIANTQGVYNFRDNNIFINPRLGGLRRRVSVQKRFGKPGASAVGDKNIDARDLKLNFTNVAETDLMYTQVLTELITMFDTRYYPVFIEDIGPLQRRLLVELDGLNDQPNNDGLFYRIGDNNIDLTALDGLWEDLTPVVTGTPSGGVSDNDNFAIFNDSSLDAYPAITVQTDDVNSEFSLINNTNGGVITIGSSGVNPAVTVIIDSTTGDVLLNDGISTVEISASMTDGSGMPFLSPGNNSYTYRSLFGSANFSFSFRRRYPF